MKEQTVLHERITATSADNIHGIPYFSMCYIVCLARPN